jgi:hypothetical protein
MSITKLLTTKKFSDISNGQPFMATMPVYTKSEKLDSNELAKEHYFFKIKKNVAVTIDKKIFVHFIGNEVVTPCIMQYTNKMVQNSKTKSHVAMES